MLKWFHEFDSLSQFCIALPDWYVDQFPQPTEGFHFKKCHGRVTCSPVTHQNSCVRQVLCLRPRIRFEEETFGRPFRRGRETRAEHAPNTKETRAERAISYSKVSGDSSFVISDDFMFSGVATNSPVPIRFSTALPRILLTMAMTDW